MKGSRQWRGHRRLWPPSAQAPLPQDPDDSSVPVRLHWSDTCGHLALCFGSGAVALYAVTLPDVPSVALDGLEALMVLHLSAFGSTRLQEVLTINVGTVRGEHAGRAEMEAEGFTWGLEGLGGCALFAPHMLWVVRLSWSRI